MSTIHPPLTISKEHTQVPKILFLNLRICDEAMKLLCWWGNFISIDRNTSICCTSSKQHLIGMEGKTSYRSYLLSHEGGQISNGA
uniref:Putative ovule protein n=1 Tax=Solanum chacoense TaxID=4108 RepID=A0A0V0GZD9_SOLCH